MRKKTMEKGYLLLTLFAFVSLIWLGTIHANAATVTVNAKFKRFYGVAEEICRQLNQKRTSNGLNTLKMDKNLTEEAMLHASQKEADAERINCNYTDNKKAVIKVPKKQLKAYKKLLKAKGIGKKVKIKK